jgi:hypothetical protein
MLYAMRAKRTSNGVKITVLHNEHVTESMRDIGFIVFDDPAKLLAEIEAGKRLLNMNYEKRNAVADYLRTMTLLAPV